MGCGSPIALDFMIENYAFPYKPHIHIDMFTLPFSL